MRKPLPETATMTISAVKSHLSSLVNEVYRGERRILIEKAGIPVAALVSIDDLERLQRLEQEWAAGTRAFERVSEAFADIPLDELEARIDDIVAAGRSRATEERRSA